MLPFYLRHYDTFADEIFVYDDASTDGSKEIISSFKGNARVVLFEWSELNYPSGLNDDNLISFWQRIKEFADGQCDWLMLPDIDEFLWAANMRLTLALAGDEGYEVIRSQGWNMTGDGIPKDTGAQIYEERATGVFSPVYSKSIIIKPAANVAWTRGRHQLENCNPKVSPPLVKLLHYRYMGGQYTAQRNARNYDRIGTDKGAAWSCHPDYKGEHSPEWAEAIKHSTTNVIGYPLCELTTSWLA